MANSTSHDVAEAYAARTRHQHHETRDLRRLLSGHTGAEQ